MGYDALAGELEGLETEGCQNFTPENLPGSRHGGWRCPAIIVQSRIGEECVFLESGDRWVSITMQISNRVLISAHLPTINAPLEDFNVTLHEIEQLIRRFPDHEVILGIDANTKVFSFEDGWHVGPCTKPAKLTSKEKERASSFTEFLTRTGLVLANTWGRENSISEATKKPWHKSELLGHIDEERDTQIDFVAVKASSRVQSFEVDHSMDTLGTDTIRSDHWPITCSISTEVCNQRPPKRTPCVVDWRLTPEWEDEMDKVWDWSRPAEVLESWRTVAAEHQILQENKHLQGYEDDLDVLVRTLKESDKNDKDRPHLCRAIWRRKRARRRHVDRPKKLECCDEGRAPPGKPKSKDINWERAFVNEEVPNGGDLPSTQLHSP